MLYIGIDVAKRSHVAAAMNDGEGIVVEPFEFRNTRKGLERLLHTLAKRGVSPEGSLVGMEATGHYWVALFDFLTANGFEAAVINPIQTDAWRKVDTVRPAKTDGIDALPIADLLRCKRFEPALAALIAGEIGDARRFETPSKLVAYAGMDATRRVSGESLDSPGHLSKRGSPHLRWALMQGAECARRFDPYFGDYYARKMSQGKHHYVALSAVARKLAGVCLALMKEDRDWSPNPPAEHLPGHLSQKG